MCLAHRRGCCECRRELQMRESGVRAGSEGPRLRTQGRGRRGGGSDGSGGGRDGEAGSEGIRGAETACAKDLGVCEAAEVVLQASAGREVLYTGPARRVRMAKAARKFGEPGNGNSGLHRALLGRGVESGRKRSRMPPRGAKLRKGGRRGLERVALASLRPRASALRLGMQGMSYTELSEV